MCFDKQQDSAGDTIDFLLSVTRDADAAKRFFQKALRSRMPGYSQELSGVTEEI